MRVNIIVESNLGVDLKLLKRVISSHSKTIEFDVYESAFKIDKRYLEHPTTHENIYSQLNDNEQTAYFNFYFTSVPYLNNYFFESFNNLVPFSLYGWDHLTNLPIENGILYFIINYLSRQLENEEFRHFNNTGCIYDFLVDKRGVDAGMRQASFCKNCLETLGNQVLTDDKELLLEDLKLLMDLLSSSSKWNKSILEKLKEEVDVPKRKRKSKVAKEINVVIASPGDLIEERGLLLNKLERKFRTDKHEDLCQHRLIVNGWEDLSSQTGYAQDVINEKIINNMDIVIAVFKHKLGTPTINQDTGKERFASGTAEEILFALDNKSGKGPLGMVYFYSTPPNPSFEAENYDKMKDEWDRLKAFKASIQNKVIYKPFTTKEELMEMVSRDLMNNIRDLFEQQ
mgnify:CR=1 FL=1